MIQPPEHIKAIQPYVPGKPIEELERELGISNSIKLASNENPLGPSPEALKAIRDSFSGLNRYPDGAGYYLKNALSEMLSVNPEELILGNGSNELLDIATRTYMQAGDDAVMASLSFVVYGMAGCQWEEDRSRCRLRTIAMTLRQWHMRSRQRQK